MSPKDKVKKILDILKKHFLMPFLICSSVSLIFTLILKLKINIISNDLIIILIEFSLLLLVLIYIYKKNYIKKINKNIFFIGIIFNISLILLNELKLVQIINTHLYMLILWNIFLFITYFFSVNKNKKSIEKYKNQDLIFIILMIAFIGLKLFFIYTHNGSYMDEYSHIFNGNSLAKYGSLSQIYEGKYYTRGLIASLLAGISLFISNNNIILIRILFSSVGIINFILLYKISKKLIDNIYVIYLLLIVYTISPWIIFEDFYIRFYIFYEFFILLNTLIAIKIINANKLQDIKNIKKYIIFFLINNILMIISTIDSGRLIIGFHAVFVITIIYIYILNINKTEKKGIFQKILEIEKKNKLKIICSFWILSIILLMILYILKIFYLPDLVYTSPNDLKYNNLFFNLNPISTILFIVTIIFMLIKYKKYKIKDEILVIIISILILFLLNMTIPLNLQNIRSIMYFFPLYYLTIFIGLDFIIKSKKDYIILTITSIIISTEIFINYPKGFINTPYIPKEIDYIDNTAYNDAKTICKNNTIIVYSNPGIALFFDIKPNYYINSKYSDNNWVTYNPDAKLAYKKDGIFYDVYSNVRIISTLDELVNIYHNNKNICIIQGGLPYSWINEDIRSFIKNNFSETDKIYKSNEDYKKMIIYTKN